MRLFFCATLAAIAINSVYAQPANSGGISGVTSAAAAWQRHAAMSHAVVAALNQADPTQLPPPLAGVADLRFSELFGPIGDRGLEYSAQLRAVDGQKVRVAGYMIREQVHAPGLFLLAGWPVTVETKGLCAIDNAPPSAVHVIVSSSATRPVAYRPGRIVLIGRIELGPRLEADGRNSALRLVLDLTSAAHLVTNSQPGSISFSDANQTP
jgi:hypothetical protein